MKKFLFKIFLFFFIIFMLSGILLGGFMVLNDLSFQYAPAIHLSNSYSLNEKLEFLRKNKKDVELMAIGSSMSLNNLHSETIVDMFSTNSYINSGAWGLNMEETYELLKLVYPYNKPEKLLISTNAYDFMKSTKVINYKDANDYLAGDSPEWWMYFKTFDLRYFVENFKFKKMSKTYPHNLEYLKYDSYGAVAYESDSFDINYQRYNMRIVDDMNIEDRQYAFVDSISRFCINHDIKLIFLQGPIREGITNTYSEEEWNFIENHHSKIKNILLNEHQYVDANDLSWKDSYFYDNTHLSKEGSRRFTYHALKKIDM